MKYLLALLAAALVIGAAWYYMHDPQTDMPNTDTLADETDTMPDDSMDDMDDDDAETSATVDLSVDADADAKVFNVTGRNFAFDTTEIRVQEGDTVTINFTSADGFHDWVVQEFDAATARVATGDTSSVTFVADTAGTYEFYCSVGTHRKQGMVGTLIVE